MTTVASVESGAPPDEVGNPYTCQAHRIGAFWCQCPHSLRTTASRDRGARTTRSTRSTRTARTASSAASGSDSISPDGPGSSRSGTQSALAESDPDPDGVLSATPGGRVPCAACRPAR
jgi:hypothetical protein